MKKAILFLSILALIVNGCKKTTKEQTEADKAVTARDTVMVKHKNVLAGSSHYSRSYSYYWLAGKDTLDFNLSVYEWGEDNSLGINVNHTRPACFTDALRMIGECLPLMEENFDISELKSIHFEEPIFYLDLATQLSGEYEQQFGRKNIGHKELNQFLLKSSITSQLDDFLYPLNKKVKSYGLEKFFLIDKEHYHTYLPDTDFTAYPAFVFNAHTGIYVSLENK